MMTALAKGLRCLAPLGGARHFMIAASQIACFLNIWTGSSQEDFISVISFRLRSDVRVKRRPIEERHKLFSRSMVKYMISYIFTRPIHTNFTIDQFSVEVRRSSQAKTSWTRMLLAFYSIPRNRPPRYNFSRAEIQKVLAWPSKTHAFVKLNVANLITAFSTLRFPGCGKY